MSGMSDREAFALDMVDTPADYERPSAGESCEFSAVVVEVMARAMNRCAGGQMGIADDDWDRMCAEDREGWRECAREVLGSAGLLAVLGAAYERSLALAHEGSGDGR